MSYVVNGLNQCGYVLNVLDGLVFHFFYLHLLLVILWYVIMEYIFTKESIVELDLLIIFANKIFLFAQEHLRRTCEVR